MKTYKRYILYYTLSRKNMVAMGNDFIANLKTSEGNTRRLF